MDEAGKLRNRCDAPGKDIKQIQGLDGMEVGKSCVNPDNPEATGT